MKVHGFSKLVVATLLGVAAMPACAAACQGGFNTGLDPTQIMTAVSLESSHTNLTPVATRNVVTLSLRQALANDSEIAVGIPVRERLSIDGLGSAEGFGDLDARYTKRISCGARWATSASMDALFATGGDSFTSGSTVLTPAVAASYQATKQIRFVVEPAYSFPIAERANFARTQTAQLQSEIIVTPTRPLYAAFGTTLSHVSGDFRYDSSLASTTVGALIHHRYNFRVTYEMPISNFAYEHIEHSRLSFAVLFQR